MKRVAILGGGIAGLAAAYELEVQRRAGKPVDWCLYEATARLGGIVQTTRLERPDGEYILEGGPDGWVTEKSSARELADELGLAAQIITSRDEEKKTYIWLDGKLVAMPDRMRMMVPEDLTTLDNSPLFTATAKQAYADELRRADELKASIPDGDESVASFIRRHFGEEVLEKIGAPLLSGVFGGDTAKLSVRAVMPAFVKMEAEHGSLILGLQAKSRVRGERAPEPTFTTLRRGMGSLVDAVVAFLPAERLYTQTAARSLNRSLEGPWKIDLHTPGGVSTDNRAETFDEVMLALPLDVARELLNRIDASAACLMPTDASSAVLACFCWPATSAMTWDVPPGFGFLVPQSAQGVTQSDPRLLAGTFTDQKFPGRAPAGCRVLRTFFGGVAADGLVHASDAMIAEQSMQELRKIFPHMPDPDRSMTSIAHWPRSLPQYEVGHMERMADLDRRIALQPGLYLLGNSYRGVGVPDLIDHARKAARLVVAG